MKATRFLFAVLAMATGILQGSEVWSTEGDFVSAVTEAFQVDCSLLQSESFTNALVSFIATASSPILQRDAELVLSLAKMEMYDDIARQEAVQYWGDCTSNLLFSSSSDLEDWHPYLLGAAYVSWQAEFGNATTGYVLGTNLMSCADLNLVQPTNAIYSIATRYFSVSDLSLKDGIRFATASAAANAGELSMASNLVSSLPATYQDLLWTRDPRDND